MIDILTGMFIGFKKIQIEPIIGLSIGETLGAFYKYPTRIEEGDNKLINYVLEEYDFSKAIVETAVVNTPAINLYKKHGFVEFKRWMP